MAGSCTLALGDANQAGRQFQTQVYATLLVTLAGASVTGSPRAPPLAIDAGLSPAAKAAVAMLTASAGQSPQPSRRHNPMASSADSGVTATAAALETRLLEGAVAQLQAQVHELQVRGQAPGQGAGGGDGMQCTGCTHACCRRALVHGQSHLKRAAYHANVPHFWCSAHQVTPPLHAYMIYYNL